MIPILLGALALGLLWSVMAVGTYCTYRVLDMADLTVEGSITLGAAVAASLITRGGNAFAATAAAFGAGLLAGAVTGVLHTKLRIPALLAGILTMISCYSVNLRIMGKANIPLLRVGTVFSFLEGAGLDKNVAVILLGAALTLSVAGALYWFFGTELGSAIRATGNNPDMVRALGISTDATRMLGLMLANGLVALSGALIAQYQSFADVQMGTGAIVIGLASIIIGEVLFGRRHFFLRLMSVVLGAITYRVIIALVLRLGMHANDLKLFTAITVAAALSLPTLRDAYLRPILKSVRRAR